MLTMFAPFLRVWDYSTAARVDEFIANCGYVQRRIWKTYRRASQVIAPPVAVETFYWRPPEDYYLIVSALVSYKRLDSAVRVFSKSGRKLRIVGEGPEYRELKKHAGPTVEFCGFVPDLELRELYSRCRAFVMPGEEDFGLTAVEAMASGKPVIALARGGALETLPSNEAYGGFLFPEATDNSLRDALVLFDRFEPDLSRVLLQARAEQFSDAAFESKMRNLLFGADEIGGERTKLKTWPVSDGSRAGLLGVG